MVIEHQLLLPSVGARWERNISSKINVRFPLGLVKEVQQRETRVNTGIVSLITGQNVGDVLLHWWNNIDGEYVLIRKQKLKVEEHS